MAAPLKAALTIFTVMQFAPSTRAMKLPDHAPKESEVEQTHRDVRQHNASRKSAHVQACSDDSDCSGTTVCNTGTGACQASVRIVGGGLSGYVEVYRATAVTVHETTFNIGWGSICAEFSSQNNGDVLCRMLGYSGGTWLDGNQIPNEPRVSVNIADGCRQCTGAEDNYFDCPFHGYCRSAQCTTHSRDAQISCQAPTPAHATGDPHMQNIHGERFDLMKPGKHVLIHIPRGVTADKALLRVQAVARRLGARCSDLYFQDINVTGKWTNSDLHYSAQVVADDTPQWTKFGPVELKVAHGHTEKGVKYLNFYVKHLGRAGAAVGGLLGEDDSAEAATPSAECRKVVSVEKMATRTAWELPGASVAIAAM